MTCIVGVEHSGGVTIGGDSAGVAGYSLTVRADQKVWRAGEFVFGFTSSFRMGQLLRYNLEAPRPPAASASQADRDRWMTTEWIDAVRKVLKNGGFAEVENNVERGGLFLVGWRGSLYVIGGDFQVGRPWRGEAAVGCGDHLALGALYCARGKPRTRVRRALEAAVLHSAGVAPPFRIVDGAKP
jgi:ATP-dependent protease HslVU (ClpYQ) peptidase subunit